MPKKTKADSEPKPDVYQRMAFSIAQYLTNEELRQVYKILERLFNDYTQSKWPFSDYDDPFDLIRLFDRLATQVKANLKAKAERDNDKRIFDQWYEGDDNGQENQR